MKYIYAIIIAVSASGSAYATCKLEIDFFNGPGQVICNPSESCEEVVGYDFGNVQKLFGGEMPVSITITPSMQCENTIDHVTVSLSGRAHEFCFEKDAFQGERCDKIADTWEIGKLENQSTATKDFYYIPTHSGKKKKRLIAEGIEYVNDVPTNDVSSQVITILGTSGFPD